ncbi:hypothetical protein B0H14DRAFT_3517162 [Mycena olivaceomarginata]|nr:hypothetical protein B0H14DRAFT_3517162 [Mycena olivaceomarginata]
MPAFLPAAPPPDQDRNYISCPAPFFPGKYFKNHAFHSSHKRRHYYMTPEAAKTSTSIVRLSTAQLASQEWRKTCRASHPQCRMRNVAADQSPRHLVGFTALYRTASCLPHLDYTSSTPPSGPVFLFVIPATASIYFDAKVACAESHRLGTKEIRVVQSFEAAVETITLCAQMRIGANVFGCPLPDLAMSIDLVLSTTSITTRRTLGPSRIFWMRSLGPDRQFVVQAEEIARGREALYERLRAKELQRQAEGPKPPPGSPPRPADYYEKRHEERKKRIALKKARRDALQKLRDNPLKGPKLPPPLPTPTLGELKRRATAERDRRERMRVRDLRVSNFEALCAQMASRKRSRK